MMSATGSNACNFSRLATSLLSRSGVSTMIFCCKFGRSCGTRLCRLVPHDRPNLQQKIIVDTPDLDSNDVANREKLQALLPVADIILYVGSQEKYHDRLGWDLFKERRQRHAFAFVLNKWDRCIHADATGLRPDEDLLNDLKAEGFEKPLL